MSIRAKLILSYLSLSILIFVVGMTFYMQLKNLIEPLTPQSIPQSVDQLSERIDSNDRIFRLLYQQIIVGKSLDNYVLSNNLTNLQNYYLNVAILEQIQKGIQNSAPALWKAVGPALNMKQQEQQYIISLMQHKNTAGAIKLLTSEEYLNSSLALRSYLGKFYFNTSNTPNEVAVVTVKLATKNTTKILQNSLKTTLVIFFDAVALSIIMALASAHAISAPIQSLRNEIEHRRNKDLLLPINPQLVQLSGEVGDLARSFDALIKRLSETTVLRDELLNEVEHRKKTELDLNTTAEQLEATNRELDQFAYSVSHDLRAPLRGIENLTQWIEEDCYDLLPENSRNHFDLLKKRVRRLDALISGILEYSRIGKTNVNLEKIAITNLLVEIIDSLSPPSHISVSIEGSMPIITTSKVAITQVFLNLIGNAIKYHDKPQGQITIGWTSLDKYHQFYVQDNGPGIHPDFHKQIFLIFQTLHPRDAKESTGIGLAMVKKIVETYGGKIWLKSAPGEGSTFYFTWPRDVEKS